MTKRNRNLHHGTDGTDADKDGDKREPEHDQDSDPPRTARAPGVPEIDEAWGREEGC